MDDELSHGLVSADSLRAFREAEAYGTAVPMSWLSKKIIILLDVVERGDVVRIEAGEVPLEIYDVSGLLEWLKLELRDTFFCLQDEIRARAR